MCLFAGAEAIDEVYTDFRDDGSLRAEAVVAALSDGKSVAVLNGRLVEAPHLKKVHKILARASRLGSPGRASLRNA
jgi:citrate lyase beta subunit